MKKAIMISIFLMTIKYSSGQLADPEQSDITTQVSGNLYENGPGVTDELDAIEESMISLQKNPLDINSHEIYKLSASGLINPLQLENLIQYRKFLGDMIDIHELQAIPGWSVTDIDKVRTCVIVKNYPLSQLLKTTAPKKIENRLLVRINEIRPLSYGYQEDSLTGKRIYSGSPLGASLKYDLVFSDRIKLGLTLEKDPGETLFRKMKRPFDFVSAVISYSNIGLLKKIIVGDFIANFGQGLIQWQSQTFGKSQEVLQVKRQSETIKPYRSFGEFEFYRGLAITLGINKFQSTFICSYRKLDARLVYDSTEQTGCFVSSLYTSGLHRTDDELTTRKIESASVIGARFCKTGNRLVIGINLLHHDFRLPVKKETEPHNLYAFGGDKLDNFSVDYSLTKSNKHIFGEIAWSDNNSFAAVNGLLLSVSSKIDLTFLHRSLSRKFVAVSSNPFRENTATTNEYGFYNGISFRPGGKWILNGYVDVFRFPWLKYMINNSLTGVEYILQSTCSFSKKAKIIFTYRSTKKSPDLTRYPILYETTSGFSQRNNLRLDLELNLSSNVSIKTRMETTSVKLTGGVMESGVLMYCDVICKPTTKRLSGNFRALFFDTDGYGSRIYAYERDLLYSAAVPDYSGVGNRLMFNLMYKTQKNLNFSIKLAKTGFFDKKQIGEGTELRKNNAVFDIKSQIDIKF